MKKLIILTILFSFCLFSFSQKYQKVRHKQEFTDSVNFNVTPLIKDSTGNYVTIGTGGVSAFSDLTFASQDTVALNTLVSLRTDIKPLFVFGGGGGNAADTASFTTSTNYGAFFNKDSDTLVITSLKGVIQTGSGTSTIGVQVYWNDTLLVASATKLNASDYTVNSTTVGNEDTSFANSKIPPNVYVWMMSPTISAGNKPKLLSVTLSGYLK